jgi:hypothetical protein
LLRVSLHHLKQLYNSLADTGAILSVNPETLGAKPLGYEIEGIEQFIATADQFFSVNASKEAKVLEHSGETVEWLGIGAVKSMVCTKGGMCVLLTETEIVAVKDMRVLMREPNNGILAVDVDESGNLVGVNNELTIIWFKLVE